MAGTPRENSVNQGAIMTPLNMMPLDISIVPDTNSCPVTYKQISIPFPKFIYWAGVETNYSQIQWTTNLSDNPVIWQTYPITYYGAPSTNTLVTIIANLPQQFFRMKQYTP